MAHAPTSRSPLGFRYYTNPPDMDLRHLPDTVRAVIPVDGGFWLVERSTGIRYRRLTMADLPRKVSFHTRGKGQYWEDRQ